MLPPYLHKGEDKTKYERNCSLNLYPQYPDFLSSTSTMLCYRTQHAAHFIHLFPHTCAPAMPCDACWACDNGRRSRRHCSALCQSAQHNTTQHNTCGVQLPHSAATPMRFGMRQNVGRSDDGRLIQHRAQGAYLVAQTGLLRRTNQPYAHLRTATSQTLRPTRVMMSNALVLAAGKWLLSNFTLKR